MGGHIAEPIWVERAMNSEEILRLWLIGKYDGANRVDPAALEMVGSVDIMYDVTKKCAGRSFSKSFRFNNIFWDGFKNMKKGKMLKKYGLLFLQILTPIHHPPSSTPITLNRLSLSLS